MTKTMKDSNHFLLLIAQAKFEKRTANLTYNQVVSQSVNQSINQSSILL